MMELVDISVLGTDAKRRVGSSPTGGKLKNFLNSYLKIYDF